MLFNTGCGGTLVNHSLVKLLRKKDTSKTKWKTKVGTFETSKKVKCKFTLPEFHENKEITWNMYVDNASPKDCHYDMIIGQNLLEELGMDFLFSEGIMIWHNVEVPMKDPKILSENKIDQYEREIHFMHDPETTEAEQI